MDVRMVAERAFAAEGLEAHSWSNEAGYVYARHEHPYHKVLFCVDGSITFHTDAGERRLEAGDRLDLPPATAHSATVGPRGVTCMEASRP